MPEPAAIRSNFFGFFLEGKNLPSGLDSNILSPVFFVFINLEKMPYRPEHYLWKDTDFFGFF